MTLTKTKIEAIRKLISQYLMVSTGCTEPIAIAYASSVARAYLGGVPEHIRVSLSSNMAKNAMDAGVPNSTYVGAAFVAAEGALFGDPKKLFELLGDISQEKQDEAYDYSRQFVAVEVADTDKPLYISILMQGNCNCCCENVEVIVDEQHDKISKIICNGKVVYATETKSTGEVTNSVQHEEVSMEDIFEYARTTEDLKVFEKAISLNTAISEHGKSTEYGLNVGKAMPFNEDTTFNRIITAATAGIDARMGGAPYPVMACTGSGNQGITTTVPVVKCAQEIGATYEQTVRAVVVADLAAMYVKKELSVLSHLCGAVIASTGASAGLVYLMGGDYVQAEYAMQNVLGTVTGMFCDGAKSTCALKVCSCLSSAIYAADLAMRGIGCIRRDVGIVNSDIAQTVKNIAKIERESAKVMNQTILEVIVR